MSKFFLAIVVLFFAGNFSAAQDAPPVAVDPCDEINCEEIDCEFLQFELDSFERLKAQTQAILDNKQAAVDDAQLLLGIADQTYDFASNLYNDCVNNSQSPNTECSALVDAVRIAFAAVQQLEQELATAKASLAGVQGYFDSLCSELDRLKQIQECCC